MNVSEGRNEAGVSDSPQTTENPSYSAPDKAWIVQALLQAITFQQSGLVAKAEQLYREIIRRFPSQPDANRNLRLIALDAMPESQLDSAVDDAPKSAVKAKKKGAPMSAEMNVLVNLFNQGDLFNSELRAIEMTQHFPNHGFGWKVLGAIHQQQGLVDDAFHDLKMAAKLLPKDSSAQYNFAQALYGQKQFSAAVKFYQQALKIQPDFAAAYVNLGATFKALGRLQESEGCYRRALKIDSTFAEAYNNLGVVLKALGRIAEAEDCYRAACKVKPDYAAAYGNLGFLLKELGRSAEAEICFIKALDITPLLSAEVHNGLGVVLIERGRLAEAEACFRKALEISPSAAEIHNNLGLVLHSMGRSTEAEAAFEKSLECDPAQVLAPSNLSVTLNSQGQLRRAEAYLRKALDATPEFVDLYINLGLNCLAQGRILEAEACYLKALQIQPDCIAAKTSLLFAMNYANTHSADECLEQARQYGHAVTMKATAAFVEWGHDLPVKRLRVGFVSGDFCQHPAAYFLENLVQHIDLSRIELIAYPTDGREDEVTGRLKPYFSAWRPLLGLNDQVAAQLIHDDGVHVLFDLSGHTAGNRLPVFAWKPAPVQVSWLGYFATTGLPAMDYFLADKVGVPESNRSQFFEKIKYLPDTRLCFTAPDVVMPVSPLPALVNGYITLASFQNMAKIGDEVLSLWASVMSVLPNAKLRLQCRSLRDAAVADDLMQRLLEHGLDTGRVTLLGSVAREVYLAAHAEVDMILDTFPFPGGTTTCEALWMGVPTLTLAGNTLIARQGASLLSAAGLADWIAESRADYVDKARMFAGNLSELARLRVALREQVLASPLFDGARFAKNMEFVLWEIWDEFQESRPNNHQSQAKHASVVQHADDEKLKSPLKPAIYIVSATRLNEIDFWSKSALGLSLKRHLKQEARLSVDIAFENSRGLAEVFNDSIDRADADAILVFIHDDVWIDEAHFADVVMSGLDCFDVIGVAGNRRRIPFQPAWAFIDLQFTWDDKSNLSGRIANGKSAFGVVSDFGAVPAECELLDGVFLAVRKSSLQQHVLRFDPQFDFHFYDMDFCRSARNAGLRLGTWLVNLTHQSAGTFGSTLWREKYQSYLYKWDAPSVNDDKLPSHTEVDESERALQEAMNEVLQIAVEQQKAGQLEQAENLYLEILNVQPKHAEANHHLGMIEAYSKGFVTALPRLEIAVQEQPQNEQFWVSYIDTLMQSGATDSAVDALELGQQYGLKSETAQMLAAEFVQVIESRQGDMLKDSSANDMRSNSADYVITTLIPAYKTEYLAELLQSLVSQTYKNFSVIISDDSPGQQVTAKLLTSEFSKLTQQLNLEIIEGPKLGKNHANIRRLLEFWADRTDLVHFLFDDDVIYPTFYEEHVHAHMHLSAEVSISRRWAADCNGAVTRAQSVPSNLMKINERFVHINQSNLAKAVIPDCHNWLGEYSNAVFNSRSVSMLDTLRVDEISIYGLGDIASFIFAADSIVWINENLGFFRASHQQITGQIQNPSVKAGYLAWVALAIIALDRQLISFKDYQQTLSIIFIEVSKRYAGDDEMLPFAKCINELHGCAENKMAFLTMWDKFISLNGFK